MRLRRGIFLVILMAPGIACAEPPAPAGFCRRLVDNIGMRQVRPLGPDSVEVETKGAGAKLFFGGGYTFSVGIRSLPGGPDAPDGNACDVARKGATCTVVGPALLRLTVKGIPVSTEAEAGEKADVQIVSSRIRCTRRG